MLEKLIDASIPKILTERVLLALLFLFLVAEDFLLITHRGNLNLFSQGIQNISVRDALYFVMVLALSWLFVLPVLKTGLTVVLLSFSKGMRSDAHYYLTNRQLLAKAINDDNSVAYQHLENHIKHVKTRQVINELYFYVLIASIVNLCCENSFTRHLFTQHPIIAFGVSLMVLYLGVAVGIIDNIENSDGITDVEVKPKPKQKE